MRAGKVREPSSAMCARRRKVTLTDHQHKHMAYSNGANNTLTNTHKHTIQTPSCMLDAGHSLGHGVDQHLVGLHHSNHLLERLLQQHPSHLPSVDSCPIHCLRVSVCVCVCVCRHSNLNLSKDKVAEDLLADWFWQRSKSIQCVRTPSLSHIPWIG
jgi:hypothetical protein